MDIQFDNLNEIIEIKPWEVIGVLIVIKIIKIFLK